MITAKVSDLFTLNANLSNFLVEYSDIVMGKISVILHYNFSVLNDALMAYSTERDKIIMKYGEKQEDGNYTISGDDAEKFEQAMKEIDEIGDIMIEVPIIAFSMEDLYKVADSVPSNKIAPLIWMTTEYQSTLKLVDDDEATK